MHPSLVRSVCFDRIAARAFLHWIQLKSKAIAFSIRAQMNLDASVYRRYIFCGLYSRREPPFTMLLLTTGCNRYLALARRQRIKPLISNDNAYEMRNRAIIWLRLMVFESNRLMLLSAGPRVLFLNYIEIRLKYD